MRIPINLFVATGHYFPFVSAGFLYNDQCLTTDVQYFDIML